MDFEFWIRIPVQIRIEIVATLDRTAEFGSKKPIKSRFKYNLDRISSRPRSNRISLGTRGLSGLQTFTALEFD